MTEVNNELLFFDVTYGVFNTLYQIFIHVLFCATFLGIKVRHNLAFSLQLPLSSWTALYIDRTAGMYPARANPHLGSKAKPVATSEPSAGIMEHTGMSTKVRNLSAVSTGK